MQGIEQYMPVIIPAAVILSVLFIAAIILLQRTEEIGETREQYLRRVKEFTEGTMDAMIGWENSWRISFDFEGQTFMYEDVEDKVTEKKLYIGYLKTKIPTQFSLGFLPKEKKGAVKSRTFFSSEPSEFVPARETPNVPKVLEEFRVSATSVKLANLLLANKHVVKILASYKGKDNRGLWFMPLKIVQGMIVLEFSPFYHRYPSRELLRKDIGRLEDCCEQFLAIHRAVEAGLKKI